jgi:hypothetical protein
VLQQGSFMPSLKSSIDLAAFGPEVEGFVDP